ncbi:MAG: hypothetical protein GXP13_03390 [Gammaproteobacteria bacterium]|nr:hypothetical protein [Gammaproteobacteria bacterium]
MGYWVQRVALEDEVEKVEEKHLQVAKNVTRDLGRYVMDVEAGIEFITSNLILKNKLDGVAKLLSKLDIRYICITDNNGNIQIELPVNRLRILIKLK